MKLADPRIISAGILFVLIIASGFWVTKLGRPLHSGPFTVHKLLALACLVLMVVIVRTMAKGMALTPAMITAVTLTFVFFAAMIATGGMLSFEKKWPRIVLLVHQIAPALTIAAASVSVLYLNKGG